MIVFANDCNKYCVHVMISKASMQRLLLLTMAYKCLRFLTICSIKGWTMQRSLLPTMAYKCVRFPMICSCKGCHAKGKWCNQRLPCKCRCCQQWHTHVCVSQRYVQTKASMQMLLLPTMAYKCMCFPTICSKQLAIVSNYISDSVEISVLHERV